MAVEGKGSPSPALSLCTLQRPLLLRGTPPPGHSPEQPRGWPRLPKGNGKRGLGHMPRAGECTRWGQQIQVPEKRPLASLVQPTTQLCQLNLPSLSWLGWRGSLP